MATTGGDMKRSNQLKFGDWTALNAYMREINQIPMLAEDELQATGARAAKGDVAAQELLVRTHLRLVVSIAHQYGGYGLPLADIVAEGNIALIRAAELYDPKFGTKFTTYASVWIKQRIHRAITKLARAVRIPVWRSQRLRKVARLNEELSSRFGRPPTETELADRLGLTDEEFTELQRDRFDVVSLDAPTALGDDESEGILARLADESATDAATQVSQRELMEELMTALHDLDDRELEVITAKFGFQPKGAISFRELGRRFGMSHEWVRRIAEMAIVKARRALEAAKSLSVMERLKRRKRVQQRIARLAAVPA
jgi:RNA polymerase primary sigma factor